ncbi:MAG: polyhydroxyalkanoic acid system family protein [Kofleriaceae bacterium]
MEINYKHELPVGDARARLEVLGEYLHNRHGIKVTWTGDRARFAGKYLVVKIDGEMSVAPGAVSFRGEDPGFLWRKKATEYIEGKLKAYLDPKVTLTDLPRSK